MQLATVPAPAQAPRRAEVPAHRDPNKDPGDFAPTNKNLRACFVCRLLKTEVQVRSEGADYPPSPPPSLTALFCTQFYESGCDNCEEFLELAGDREKVQAYTTTSFSG